MVRAHHDPDLVAVDVERVVNGARAKLPTDADLHHIIKVGMPYSSMPAWPHLTDGEIDHTAGLLLLLFVGYQLWGTGIYESQQQSDLHAQFQADLTATRQAQQPVSGTTTTTTPTTEPLTTTLSGTLPATGSSSTGPLAGGALALIVVGIVLLAINLVGDGIRARLAPDMTR